jgi:hypothetical protein
VALESDGLLALWNRSAGRRALLRRLRAARARGGARAGRGVLLELRTGARAPVAEVAEVARVAEVTTSDAVGNVTVKIIGKLIDVFVFKRRSDF